MSPPARDTPTRDTPAVEFVDVHAWFGTTHVLRAIDLGVAPGETVVICGPSGSGKSTLIRAVNGLVAHQTGTIRVAGLTLDGSAKATDAVRARVGMVFQSFNLFPHLSVLENCTLAPLHVRRLGLAAARDLALGHLDRVGLADKAESRPDELSGGQQQRVAIARALCLDPTVMLLDEPTSALDPERVGEVLDVLTDLAKGGTTLLCVTHEMGFARAVADRVVFMDEGQIVEIAPPDAFFTQAQHPRTRAFLSRILA